MPQEPYSVAGEAAMAVETRWSIVPRRGIEHDHLRDEGWRPIGGATSDQAMIVTSRDTGAVEAFVIQRTNEIVVVSQATPRLERLLNVLHDWGPIQSGDAKRLARHMPRGLQLHARFSSDGLHNDTDISRLSTYLGGDLTTAAREGLKSPMPLRRSLTRRVKAPYVDGDGTTIVQRRGTVTEIHKDWDWTKYSRANLLFAIRKWDGVPLVVAVLAATPDGSDVAVAGYPGLDFLQDLKDEIARSGDATWNGLRKIAASHEGIIGPFRQDWSETVARVPLIPESKAVVGVYLRDALPYVLGWTQSRADKFVATNPAVRDVVLA